MIMTTSTPAASPAPAAPHVCPWWLGPILASPLRRLIESPERLLAPFVGAGMTIVEPGCGMGYFTLPLARLVGPAGRVVAADVQPRMIDGLVRRAKRKALADRIVPIVCGSDAAELEAFAGSADLAVAIHMLHEVPDRARLLGRLAAVVKPGGTLLVVEPKGHLPAGDFERTLDEAEQAGFSRTGQRVGGRDLSAVLIRR